MSLRDFRQPQMISRQGGDFTGDSDDTVPIRPSGSDLKIINHVAASAAEVLGERLSDRRVGRQDQRNLSTASGKPSSCGEHIIP